MLGVTTSLKKDGENWWIEEADEVEVAAASGNSHTVSAYAQHRQAANFG